MSLGFGSQVGRRLTSASPLVGRGSNLPLGSAAGVLDNASQFDQGLNFNDFADDEGRIQYGRSDISSSLNRGRGVSSRGGGHTQADDFEIFGPAANVDTQTAGASQWVQDALDRESNNFFEFVRHSIIEKYAGFEEVDGGFRDVGGEIDGTVSFEELFDAEKNSQIVAAQAFYHVLTLATRSVVRVWQGEGVLEGEDRDEKEREEVVEMEARWGPRMLPFGEIRLDVVS